jgi:translation elongation factor EF-Ts
LQRAELTLGCGPPADAATDIAASTNVEQLASQLAMHVAAIRPTYLSAAAVPAAVLAAQRAVFEAQVRAVPRRTCALCIDDSASAQAAASGKPAKILDKMVQGMMHKW